MKKVILFVCVLLLCSACTKSQPNKAFDTYQEVKEALMNYHSFDQKFPFDIQLVFNPIAKKYRYDIIINQPQIDMYDIQALAYAQENDEQSCPAIGFFDQEPYHLKMNYVNKLEHFYKGIQLSGECEEKGPVRVYVSYYTDETKTNKETKYIEVMP